jgi:SAM-dependent methyltransferase
MSLHKRIYQRVLGHPFVYDRVRPLVIGGLDYSTYYAGLGVSADDVLFDVGCGTGDALNYLTTFRAFHGFDPDSIAIARARQRLGSRENIWFEDREMVMADLERLKPTVVFMTGLLHHMPDDAARTLLRSCLGTPSVRKVATVDPVYLPGHPFNNMLARFDRGRFVREQEPYLALARSAGATVYRSEIMRSHPTRGRAYYLTMFLGADGSEVSG